MSVQDTSNDTLKTTPTGTKEQEHRINRFRIFALGAIIFIVGDALDNLKEKPKEKLQEQPVYTHHLDAQEVMLAGISENIKRQQEQELRQKEEDQRYTDSAEGKQAARIESELHSIEIDLLTMPRRY